MVGQWRPVLAVVTVGLFTVLAFQNCSENGFKSADHGATDSSSLVLSPAQSDVNIVASVLSKLEAQSDMTFEITSDGFYPTMPQWSHTYNGVAGGCTEKNGKTNATYIVNCASAGALEIQLQGKLGEQQRSFPTYSATLVSPPAPATPGTPAPEIAMKVTFSIPAATARNNWNAVATPVEVFVGQTLEIKNDDTIVHRLHTNGRPFPHGNNIAVGASGNYVVAQAYNRATNGAVYDHIVGTASNFYLVAYDGTTLYNNNCASCHGALNASEQKNARVSGIKGAIANVAEMRAVPALVGLTQRQIEAISYALGGR